MSDRVGQPEHYTSHPAGVEMSDIAEHFGFCLGNVIKYVWRANLKGEPVEDLKKAQWYLAREIARRESATPAVTEGKPADWADVEPSRLIFSLDAECGCSVKGPCGRHL